MLGDFKTEANPVYEFPVFFAIEIAFQVLFGIIAIPVNVQVPPAVEGFLNVKGVADEGGEILEGEADTDSYRDFERDVEIFHLYFHVGIIIIKASKPTEFIVFNRVVPKVNSKTCLDRTCAIEIPPGDIRKSCHEAAVAYGIITGNVVAQEVVFVKAAEGKAESLVEIFSLWRVVGGGGRRVTRAAYRILASGRIGSGRC